MSSLPTLCPFCSWGRIQFSAFFFVSRLLSHLVSALLMRSWHANSHMCRPHSWCPLLFFSSAFSPDMSRVASLSPSILERSSYKVSIKAICFVALCVNTYHLQITFSRVLFWFIMQSRSPVGVALPRHENLLEREENGAKVQLELPHSFFNTIQTGAETNILD